MEPYIRVGNVDRGDASRRGPYGSFEGHGEPSKRPSCVALAQSLCVHRTV